MTPWAAACQASLSFTISWSLLRLMSNKPVMPSNHLLLCHPLLLLLSIFSSIRVFSNVSALCIRWPKYWRFSQTRSREGRGWGLSPLTVQTSPHPSCSPCPRGTGHEAAGQGPSHHSVPPSPGPPQPILGHQPSIPGSPRLSCFSGPDLTWWKLKLMLAPH